MARPRRMFVAKCMPPAAVAAAAAAAVLCAAFGTAAAAATAATVHLGYAARPLYISLLLSLLLHQAGVGGHSQHNSARQQLLFLQVPSFLLGRGTTGGPDASSCG